MTVCQPVLFVMKGPSSLVWLYRRHLVGVLIQQQGGGVPGDPFELSAWREAGASCATGGEAIQGVDVEEHYLARCLRPSLGPCGGQKPCITPWKTDDKEAKRLAPGPPRLEVRDPSRTPCLSPSPGASHPQGLGSLLA